MTPRRPHFVPRLQLTSCLEPAYPRPSSQDVQRCARLRNMPREWGTRKTWQDGLWAAWSPTPYTAQAMCALPEDHRRTTWDELAATSGVRWQYADRTTPLELAKEAANRLHYFRPQVK